MLSKAIDECDWLELKASFFVSNSDPDFSNDKLLSKKPDDYSARQWLDELNKGRIVKDIVAMYNSRGGVMASDMHRVGFLTKHLSNVPKSELGAIDKGLSDRLKSLIDALDNLAKLSMREDAPIREVRKSFDHVETETELLFRRADVLCKDRLQGPFRGLIHRVGDALQNYQ